MADNLDGVLEGTRNRFSVISEINYYYKSATITEISLPIWPEASVPRHKSSVVRTSKTESLRKYFSEMCDLNRAAVIHLSFCNRNTSETLSFAAVMSMLERMNYDIDREEIKEYFRFKNGHIHFNIYNDQFKTSTKQKKIKCNNGDKTVTYELDSKCDCYGDILANQNFVDVTFYLEGQTIKAHKVILSRVPYFKRLFENGSKEYHLKDIKYVSFKQVLKCIYTDEIPLLNFKSAYELYVIANDFGFYHLQQICASYLGGNLTTENCLLVLILSKDCKDRSLLEACLEFIKASDIRILAENAL